MPELPELVYDSLRQGKYLQHSVDKIARELQSNHVRQGQSRYFLGIGATLVLSGTFLLVSRPEWGLMPGWLMAGGLIAWFVGWRKHADFSSLKAGRVTYNAALFNHHLPQRNMYGWYQYLAVIDYCRHRCTAFGTKSSAPSVPILVRRSKALKSNER